MSALILSPCASGRRINGGKQRRVLQRLRQKGNGACRFTPLAHSDLIMSRNDDGRYSNALACEILLKLQAGHFWHLQIGDETIGQPAGQRSEEFSCRSVCSCIERTRAEQPRQSLQHGRVIVHNGDPTRGLRHATYYLDCPQGRRVGPRANIWNDQLCIDLDRNTGLFRQADKIRDRAYPQLFHHPAAVDLDGLFRRSQIACNLLVESASDHMREYFALAWRQARNFGLDQR